MSRPTRMPNLRTQRAQLAQAIHRAQLELKAAPPLVRAGMLKLESPGQIRALAKAVHDYGAFAAAPRIGAVRHPARTAIADDRGEITFAELDEQVNRLANAFRDRGLAPGARIGLMCRNDRAPLIGAFAAGRAGLDVIWLNTGFSARQATEVAMREQVDLLIHDQEFADTVAQISPPASRIQTSSDDSSTDALQRLIDSGASDAPARPPRTGRVVFLTSGTTGTPKGAARPDPRGLVLAGSVVERLPLRQGTTTVVAPPVFHGTGVLLVLMTLTLSSKVVMRRTFDPGQFLQDLTTHRAEAACVVPVMLQRLLALPDEEWRLADLSALNIIFCAGSALPAGVIAKARERIGEVIYNLYGSTEVALATMATPDDVRVAPASVGRPLLGSRVKILGPSGAELPPGATGRIFVGTLTPFEGYTGGGSKEIIDGMLSTGDLGHFDAAGRLYIDGRDDEMIVSGGENVFPREVEELLATHPAVFDAAAVGVPDEEFGQRLVAFVVTREGMDLDEGTIKSFVKGNLARYKVPRSVVFLDELPRNPTGKLLKRQLLERVNA